MKPTFLNGEKPLLTLLFTGKNPEEIIEKVTLALQDGVEGFCLQTCQMEEQYHNRENYRKIFAAMGNRPIYVTNYRHGVNETASDQTIGEGLVELAESGATLCDVMGDLFDPQPGEMTTNPEAIKKQMQLIGRLREAGAEVIMSSHVLTFTPAERVLEIALGPAGTRGGYRKNCHRRRDHGGAAGKPAHYLPAEKRTERPFSVPLRRRMPASQADGPHAGLLHVSVLAERRRRAQTGTAHAAKDKSHTG